MGGVSVAVGIGCMGVVVAGTRVLAGGIGVVAVAVSGIGVGARAQAVAARTNPIATSKDPSLFLLIAKPPFRVVGKFRKGRPAAQDDALGAVLAVGGFVLALDDGEGVHDVVRVVVDDAVEVEVDGV